MHLAGGVDELEGLVVGPVVVEADGPPEEDGGHGHDRDHTELDREHDPAQPDDHPRDTAVPAEREAGQADVDQDEGQGVEHERILAIHLKTCFRHEDGSYFSHSHC